MSRTSTETGTESRVRSSGVRDGNRRRGAAPDRARPRRGSAAGGENSMADPGVVRQALAAQRIETPSWAYANSGTRFKVFAQAGVPRTPQEKIADAATVHRFTGVAPTVALHIPWDAVDDYAALAAYAEDLGIRLGAINTNVFQDDDYKLGSVTNPAPKIRRKATDQLLEAVDIMDATGSRDLKFWFADGINYPGQDDLRDRQ